MPYHRPDVLTGLVLCPYRRLTRRSCPVCGTTRALAALGRGDVPGSVAAHPLGPLTALVAAHVVVHRRPPKYLTPYLVLLVLVWSFRLRRGDIR